MRLRDHLNIWGGVKPLTLSMSDMGVRVLLSPPKRGFIVTPVHKGTFCGLCGAGQNPPPQRSCSAFHCMPFHVNGALCWRCKLTIHSKRISQAVSSCPLYLGCTHLAWLLCSILAQDRNHNRMRKPPDLIRIPACFLFNFLQC